MIEGTTSACAENTSPYPQPANHPGNYLRVRGEYDHVSAGEVVLWELPPRARRILTGAQSMTHTIGTTSACAENTVVFVVFSCVFVELPPRARRIRLETTQMKLKDGTTSACAENTAGGTRWGPPYLNYLRVRGEYQSRHRRGRGVAELPPRARRIQCCAQSWCH